MKKVYFTPEAEIEIFKISDIVRTSNGGIGQGEVTTEMGETEF